MTDLQTIHESAKDLLENTTAIKGEAFVRSARVAFLMRSMLEHGLHACECNSPVCGAKNAIALHGTFAAAMAILVGHMSGEDQGELATLLENLTHLHNTAADTLKGSK